MRGRRPYSPAFKQEALALLEHGGRSANQLAKDLGVNQTTLSRWQRQAKADRPEAHALEATEELSVLRREVQRLRLERDILKKAAAFFAKESE